MALLFHVRVTLDGHLIELVAPVLGAEIQPAGNPHLVTNLDLAAPIRKMVPSELATTLGNDAQRVHDIPMHGGGFCEQLWGHGRSFSLQELDGPDGTDHANHRADDCNHEQDLASRVYLGMDIQRQACHQEQHRKDGYDSACPSDANKCPS